MLGLDLDAATEGAPFLSEAVALAEQDTNKESRVRVLCLVAWGRTWASGTVDSDLLERALELAQGSANQHVLRRNDIWVAAGHGLRE